MNIKAVSVSLFFDQKYFVEKPLFCDKNQSRHNANFAVTDTDSDDKCVIVITRGFQCEERIA